MTYYEYEEEEKALELARKKQQERNKIVLVLLILGAGTTYFFLVYLPKQKQIKELEEKIQTDIDKLNTVQPAEYQTLLTKLQGYLDLANGTEWQQTAFSSKEEVLKKAVEWLQEVQRQELTRENQEVENQNQQRQREREEVKRREEQMIKEKKFHWLREPKSWADDWLVIDKEQYTSKVLEQGIEKSSAFSSFAHYKIHFPPTLWNSLSDEQKKFAKEKGYGELKLDEETKTFEFSDEIEDWYNKTFSDPKRGQPDQGTKKDNNALFFGTEGTGKTSIVRKLTFETDCYPMIEVKGSTLSPNKLDGDIGITPLSKFILTICDIEHTLEDYFGFQRKTNGEVRFILFVDEADLVAKDARLSDYSYLNFLKECMEQVSKEKQTENLYLFATNEIKMIARAVYRPGRLSNPLDFSWTLGDFMRYSQKAGISSQFPMHWIDNPVLNQEDNKWVNRFNLMSFQTNFLGKKLDGTPIPNATPFWNKFINNPETQKILNEEKETNEQGEEIIKKKGIQWGEFFEFFWNLKDTGQLQHFDGKFISPKPPKIEDVVSQSLGKTTAKIDETLATRLEEMNERIIQIREELSLRGGEYVGTLNMGITQITMILSEIGRKINN